MICIASIKWIVHLVPKWYVSSKLLGKSNQYQWFYPEIRHKFDFILDYSNLPEINTGSSELATVIL